ncbi:hypothetical protein [Azospirillum picis]|uniref:Uncharacterized protein n=1 Tax=Azospirillum picis TaxID=488438 RepID=A0ABU0MQ38_9PROT|nr:hypothetical protein [Azospirillum picis]MBP2302126.1 hypothetical protein [Azospirillum picis]MDQ0535583.1 hypothetical protein [Azospirillum picis]
MATAFTDPPAIVKAVHTVRLHSRDCHDLETREYLIRVERRLVAMVQSDFSPMAR